MLPTHNVEFRDDDSPSPSRQRRRRGSSVSGGLHLYISRILTAKQMDFELALWQLVYLVISPRRVYRNGTRH
jgi:UNC-50 family